MTFETRPKIYRAGMVPYYIDDNDRVRMLFMKPTQTEWSGDEFQIAKGRCDEGEHHSQTAIREAKEELGLMESNLLDDPYHVGQYMGRTDVWICLIDDPELFGEPSDETADTAWMTITEFLDEGRKLHQPVVFECYRDICRIEEVDPEVPLTWRF